MPCPYCIRTQPLPRRAQNPQNKTGERGAKPLYPPEDHMRPKVAPTAVTQTFPYVEQDT
jgi:hypothetical protein